MAEYIQKVAKKDDNLDRNKSILQETIDDDQLMEFETANLRRTKADTIVENAVIKKSRLYPDKFIAKLKGTGNIIKYDGGSDEVEQVNPNDVNYQIYKKNVEHDFVDVRIYGFRPNDTNDKLLLMAKFAFDKELFVCKK
ncbi:Hypothetical predicted protein [Mytilus galloprovincialis]|uniref:Uncharacterized protein n=1 Tax=Mytilus galloprovincialis TaxID=29158 RepID=A0A8B6HGR3_MYTGA|nr:Hypothetical predicted protein [Mytilus galloprovincialis]